MPKPSYLKPKKTPIDDAAEWAAEEFYFDPNGFIDFVYPWKEEGSPLYDQDGPDIWQREVNNYIGRTVAYSPVATRVAVASGHGIGKSAEMSWLIQWFISTRPRPVIVATANTKAQLTTRLWRELSLWHDRSMFNPLYEWTATTYRLLESPATWSATAQPWSANNPDAFAGFHAADVMILFDEASAIDAKIWEVIEGAMTTPGTIFVVFGNPTRSSGCFFDCFHKNIDLWKTWQVDSRTCKMTNKEQIKQWEEVYGEDSDFFRVRVKGQFPRVGSMQLIPTDLVDMAMARLHLQPMPGATRALGVDVARFGDDASVITRREENIVYPQQYYKGMDLMALAAKVAYAIDEFDPDAVFVDGVGMGAGVVDRLRQLGFSNVIDVQSAHRADEPTEYFNKRAEMWGRFGNWLKGDVQLPKSTRLREHLIGTEYGFSIKDQIQLERKEDAKKRGLESPDCGDSVALTFAEPIRPARIQTLRSSYIQPAAVDWRLI